jgi:prefoldin subunit 5
MKRFLPYLIALAAIILAGTAAYYSIFGLSKFYAGAATAVIIMGIAIESGKVIATSVLHQYHKVLSWPVKIYLTLAIVLSMIITSAGIYGFLTNAYQSTASKVELLDGEVSVIEKKKEYFQSNIERIQTQINGKNARVTTLTTVRTQQETRLQSLYDAKSTGAAKRTEQSIKDADKQINALNIEIDSLNSNITSLNDSISNLDRTVLEKNANSDVAGEVGPLRFISKLTGASMNSVVNWFTILLILIFDPLAVALVIVLNRITMKNEPPKNDSTKIWKRVAELRRKDKLPKLTDEEIANEPTALANSEYVETSAEPEDIYDEKPVETRKRPKPGKRVYW